MRVEEVSAATQTKLPAGVSRPDQVTVLMYHAIDSADAVAADRHYSVERSTFAEQLRLIKAGARSGRCVRDLIVEKSDRKSVAITFDDGHVSNLHAAETLAAVGMSADFFVNPASIGQPGFLTWAQLREMLGIGMSIQSHGMQHRYLSDLAPDDVWQELTESKDTIEQALGSPVNLFAPPGGRMPPRFALTAARAGYDGVCSSRVDFWQPERPSVAQHEPIAMMIPRLAVLNLTDRRRFVRWIEGSRREMFLMKLRGSALDAAKRAIGNQRYERVRGALLGGLDA